MLYMFVFILYKIRKKKNKTITKLVMIHNKKCPTSLQGRANYYT